MGYKSDVTILFYAEEKDFPILKLWVQENLRPVLDEHWEDAQGNGMHEEEFKRGNYKGYAFEFADVKWYDDDPDVVALNEAWEKFNEIFDKDNTTELYGEYARIGEDYGDVEYKCSYHTQDLLSVVRRAEY
jgi:hypothetical protein